MQTAHANRLRLTYKDLKLGRRLTDQQLWCLGCDVRHVGFPWESLGWRYLSRPDKKRGCGRLLGSLPRGGHLSVWGFGFVASDPTHGALWLDRRNFRPRWKDGFAPNTAIWALNEVPGFHPPLTKEKWGCTAFLLSELCTRMAEHERDVLAILGLEYRNLCVRGWKQHRTALPPNDLPDAWLRLAGAALDSMGLACP